MAESVVEKRTYKSKMTKRLAYWQAFKDNKTIPQTATFFGVTENAVQSSLSLVPEYKAFMRKQDKIMKRKNKEQAVEQDKEVIKRIVSLEQDIINLSKTVGHLVEVSGGRDEKMKDVVMFNKTLEGFEARFKKLEEHIFQSEKKKDEIPK